MSLNKIKSPLKELFLVFFLAVFGLAMHLGVRGQVSQSVTATVTAQQVALSVSDGSVAYGTLSTGTTASTATGDSDSIDDTQVITNNGNVDEDFELQGQNSSPDSWILAATSGENQYVHEYCTSDCDGSPTWTALTTSYASIATGVSATATQDFDLRIIMPSSTTVSAEQSVDVTVQATASN